MSDVQEYDFSNLVCPKPLIETKKLIKNSVNGATFQVIVPTDSALRLKEMVKKQGWHVMGERKEGHRHYIIVQQNIGGKESEAAEVVQSD